MNDPEQDDMANAPSTEDSPPTASEPNAAAHNHVSFEDVISGAFDSETAVDASAPEQGEACLGRGVQQSKVAQGVGASGYGVTLGDGGLDC